MMSSLTSLKATTEPAEVFLDDTNLTQFNKFISDKLTMVKADKNAVDIAVTKAVGMSITLFKNQTDLETGQKEELKRKGDLILKAFRTKNAEHVALIENMSESTGAERIELMKHQVKIATMKTAYVESLNEWFDYIGVILQRYVSPSMAATLNAETDGLWDKVSGEVDEGRPDGCMMGWIIESHFGAGTGGKPMHEYTLREAIMETSDEKTTCSDPHHIQVTLRS